MLCPQCGASTQVVETRGAYRDRRCQNLACRLAFTTRENVMTLEEAYRICARTCATQKEKSHRRRVARAILMGARGQVLGPTEHSSPRA
jgi:hypothetical protein